jgi:hypothetical protein
MRLKTRLRRLAQRVVKKKGYDYAAVLDRQRQSGEHGGRLRNRAKAR